MVLISIDLGWVSERVVGGGWDAISIFFFFFFLLLSFALSSIGS